MSVVMFCASSPPAVHPLDLLDVHQRSCYCNLTALQLITAFLLHAGGCFRSPGDLGIAQERPRGQAEASPGVGDATRTLSVLTRRPSTRGHRRRPKAAAQRNFWLEGVESGQKSLPVRRHHV